MTSEAMPAIPRRFRLPDAVLDALPMALAAVAILVYLASELFVLGGLGLPLDDSWIHLHLARRLAAGDGLIGPGGDWVGGSTAPLWTALVALGAGVAPVAWAKALGALCFLATVHATSRLARELGASATLGRLAATLVALTPWLVWSALSGMEILLFTSLSLWGLILHRREGADPERPPASLPVLALAALARPEGWLLLALALAERCSVAGCGGRAPGALARRLAAGLGAAALVALPTLCVYKLLGGSFLPSTVAAKASSGASLVPDGRYLRSVIDVLFRSQPVALIFAGAGVLRLLERWGASRGGGLLPALWLLGLPVVSAALAPAEGPVVVGNFGRYFFPLLPLVAVLGVLGWERSLRRLGRPGLAVLVTVALLPQLWGLARGPLIYTGTIADVEGSDVAAARWLAARVPAGATLAAQDVGALGYHLPNPVIDLAGVTRPEILPILHGAPGEDPAAWQDRLHAYLAEHQPAWLVVFPEYYPQLVRRPGFRPVRSFQIPDNRTMAGDELVIFSTPWTGSYVLREPAAGGGTLP